MKKIVSLILLISALSIVSCKQKQTDQKSDYQIVKQDTAMLLMKDSAFRRMVRNEHLVMSTLYQQTAAEYRALCYQAFNIGKVMLDMDLADKTVNKHRIIVLDIDETVLDNSDFEAKCILESTVYPKYWDEWCQKASAEPLPGAVEFLKYARANGVSIFYVTNRKEYLKDITIKNLADKGFPHADADHVIARTDEASKEARRQELLNKYHISLLFGDNLNDFAEDFEGLAVKPRKDAVDRFAGEFGKRFIVLPNAMYGDWEDAIYGYNTRIDDSVKFQLRRKALRSF